MVQPPRDWKAPEESASERSQVNERAEPVPLPRAVRRYVRTAWTSTRDRLPLFFRCKAPLLPFHPKMKTLVPLDRAMFTFLGLEISGDLGDVTMWRTRRGKIVCYPRTVPGKVPSIAQQNHRQHFRESVARWNLLSKQQKADYETASMRLSLPMTGHDLWIRWTFAGTIGEARTIERLAGVTLVLPPELS